MSEDENAITFRVKLSYIENCPCTVCTKGKTQIEKIKKVLEE